MNFTEEQLQALKLVDELKEETGSYNKACQKIGISASALSSIRKGDYKGNIDNVFGGIIAYFETKIEAKSEGLYKEVAYAPTSISSKVYKTIRNAHLRGGFIIATGDAGIGKTKAIQKYCSDYPESTVHITIHPCCKSTKALLKLIAAKINVPISSSVDDLWLAVANKLHDGMIIIVDEGQLLLYNGLETLRSFADYYDSIGQTLGVAIVGNNGIRERLEGKNKEQYRQLNNRTWQRPHYITKDITEKDMALIFPLLVNMPAELSFLHKVAQTPHGVRGAVRLFANAYDSGDYSLERIADFAKAMRIDVRIKGELI